MQHRSRRGSRRVRFRSPGVKREKRNQNPEAEQQQQENISLRFGRNQDRRFLQDTKIKAARGFRHGAIKHDQAEQQNETAGCEIDRDLPGGDYAIAAAPDSDEQERRDERELVKGVEEKQIERRERAHRSGGDEKQARVKCVSMLRDFARKPDSRESNERGEEQHNQAQAVDTEREIDVPVVANRKRRDHFVSAVRIAFEPEEEQQGRAECNSSRPQRGAPCRSAEQDRQRRRYWKQDYKKQDHRKMVK